MDHMEYGMSWFARPCDIAKRNETDSQIIDKIIPKPSSMDDEQWENLKSLLLSPDKNNILYALSLFQTFGIKDNWLIILIRCMTISNTFNEFYKAVTDLDPDPNNRLIHLHKEANRSRPTLVQISVTISIRIGHRILVYHDIGSDNYFNKLYSTPSNCFKIIREAEATIALP